MVTAERQAEQLRRLSPPGDPSRGRQRHQPTGRLRRAIRVDYDAPAVDVPVAGVRRHIQPQFPVPRRRPTISTSSNDARNHYATIAQLDLTRFERMLQTSVRPAQDRLSNNSGVPVRRRHHRPSTQHAQAPLRRQRLSTRHYVVAGVPRPAPRQVDRPGDRTGPAALSTLNLFRRGGVAGVPGARRAPAASAVAPTVPGRGDPTHRPAWRRRRGR